MVNHDALQLFGILLAIAIAAYLLVLGTIRAFPSLRSSAASFRAALVDPFEATFDTNDRRQRMEDLQNELRRVLGQADAWGDEARADVVRAAIAAQEISALNRLLRDGVRKCLRTHWAVIRGLNATHMIESARHPLSQRQRLRVIDLTDLLSQKIARYPLLDDSADLIGLHLALRSLPGVCAACVYFNVTVADAPRLCPAANAMFGKPPNDNPPTIEGEIINDCENDRP